MYLGAAQPLFECETSIAARSLLADVVSEQGDRPPRQSDAATWMGGLRTTAFLDHVRQFTKSEWGQVVQTGRKYASGRGSRIPASVVVHKADAHSLPEGGATDRLSVCEC